MCNLLNISRALVYYTHKPSSVDYTLHNLVIKIFNDSRSNYGSRKIKVELAKLDHIVSRRLITRIMKLYGLVSNYTVKQFKKPKASSNNSDIPNILDRNFLNRKCLEVIISDLTYVRVINNWAYVCLIIDLFNREIVGHSASYHKDVHLVVSAFSSIRYDLNFVDIFHSDRVKEFDNKIIDDVLAHFNINRSLSNKGNPYDNAVAEATYKIFKTEFCLNRKFDSLLQFQAKQSFFL